MVSQPGQWLSSLKTRRQSKECNDKVLNIYVTAPRRSKIQRC